MYYLATGKLKSEFFLHTYMYMYALKMSIFKKLIKYLFRFTSLEKDRTRSIPRKIQLPVQANYFFFN